MFQSSVTSTLGYNSVILSIEIAFPSVCNAPDARRGSCAKRRIFPESVYVAKNLALLQKDREHIRNGFGNF